ncbi:hypothetical protein [Rickettsia helvetica]|nr:hypothetical protein [Rickettsia helvetica]
MRYDLLDKKKKKLDDLRPLSSELTKNLEEWFKVGLTYTSNAIEGNTLSCKETAIVIEKGLTIGGKASVEHLEAMNHAKALDMIHKLAKKKYYEITEKDIWQYIMQFYMVLMTIMQVIIEMYPYVFQALV